MNRRIIALVLALCLVMSTAPVYAGAVNGQQVTANAVTVTAGNTATVTLKAENLNNIAALDVYIYYDANALTVTGTHNGNILSNAQTSVNTAEAGVIKLSAMALNGISGSGNLLSVYFSTKSDCTPGKYPIMVAIGRAYDTMLSPATIGSVSGSVTVNKPVETETFSIDSVVDRYTLQKGNVLSYYLYNSGCRYFASGDFVITYDHTAFAFDSLELSSQMAVEGAVYSVNSSILGQIRLTYASTDPVNAYELFTLKLKVISNADGVTEIRAQASNMYRQDLSMYLPATISRSLTLQKLPDVIDYPDAFLTTQELVVGQQSESVFSLEAGAGVGAADFTLTYDPAVLKCLQVTAAEEVADYGGMLVIDDDFGAGTIRFSYVNMSGYGKTDIGLVNILWEPLQSPENHYQIKVDSVGVVDATQNRLTLEHVTDTGHIYVRSVIPPVCLEDGYTNFACPCGAGYNIEPVDKLGHDIQKHPAKDETCAEVGWYAYETCSRCDYSTYVEKPTNQDHDIVYHQGKEPNCTQVGWDAYETCSRCDYSTYAEKPTNQDHDIVCHQGKEPNCTQVGWYAYDTCSRCEYTTYAEIPAKGHSFVHTICSVCGDKQQPLQNWDVSAAQDGSLIAYLYKNHAEGGHEMEILGSGDMVDYYYNAPWYYPYGETLTRVTLPEGMTSIGNTAFYNCAALRYVRIPDSVEAIGDYAFYGCKNLVISVTGDAFPAQQGLIWYWGAGCYLEPQQVILDENATYVIDGEGNAVLAKYISGGDEFAIRETVGSTPVTQIGEYAFYQVRDMAMCWIPQRIQAILSNAFYDAAGISILFEATTLPDYLGSSWNGSCPYFLAPLGVLEESDFVYVLDRSQELYLVTYKADAQEITVPAEANGYPVKHIVDYAFQNKSTERIFLPEGLLTVGNYAFYNCYYLQDIQLPQSLTSIGTWAFAYCTALTGIVIPDNVTALEGTFVNCYALKSVTLPQKLNHIGGMTFYGCYALEELDIPEQVHSLNSYSMFDNCSALKLVYVRSSELAATLTSASAACGLLRYAQTVVVPAGTGTDYLTSAYSYCESAQRGGVNVDIYSLSAHQWQTQTVTEKIPCQTDGYLLHICSLCSVQTDTVIPRHTMVQTVVAPTCTEAGYTLHRCPDCAETERTDPVEKLGHNYNEAPLTCGVCGHARVTLVLNKVVLRPGVAGIYFKGNVTWDAEDTGILRCGIAVSLENPLPVADGSDPSCLYTQGGVSALITNILDSENNAVQNGKNSRMPVYARAYVQLADGQILYSNPVQASLQQVVMTVDNHWDALSDTQKDAIASMYESFSDVMKSWQIPNIKSYI